MDFAVRLIENTERENKKALKESSTILTEEFEEELEDVPEEEVTEEDVPAEEEDAVELETVNTDNADEFTESLSDKVFYCASCCKHFLATEDTPEESIVCPVCESDELIVSIGSAEVALEEPENEDVALEIQEEAEEEPSEELNPNEYAFDEENLEEGLNILVKKYIKDSKDRVSITGGKITNEGNILLRGKHGKRPISVVLEGFKANSQKQKFVLPGRSDLFKGCKLNCGVIVEGKTYKVAKFGFGFLMESAKGTSKIKGIIG